MAETGQATEAGSAGKINGLYHHVKCDHLAGLTVKLDDTGGATRRALAILGISSKESIETELKAVDASPFETVFVVREETGEVLFALSKNEDYVKLAKKKRPKPDPGPAPEPESLCCIKCRLEKGGTRCDDLEGACICWHDDDESSDFGLDDPLDILAP